MARRDLVAALDVGTTKVLALVAQVERGEASIIGVGVAPARGMRKGVVVDIEGTARAIRAAVDRAERMCGLAVEAVYLGVAGNHVQSQSTRAIVAVTGRGQEIEPEDVERVLEAARVLPLPPDREILHVIPRQYVVDGFDGVRDPVGMAGSRLEVEAQVITAARPALQNLFRCVERAGLEVEEAVFAPLAAAEAVLLEDEKELGVALADVGGGTTDVAVFQRGSLSATFALPAGGDHITTDVAIILRTSLAQAESVKVEHGWACGDLAPESRMFSVPGVAGQGTREVSAKHLAEIIEARLRELLAGLGDALRQAGLADSLPGGVVLTGGVAATRGIERVAAEELNLPVRVGSPAIMGGWQDVAAGPAAAAGAGLLAYAVRRGQGQRRPGRLGRWREWLRGLF